MEQIFLEIKWATRFDSPACLDTFDHEYSVVNTNPKVVIEEESDGVSY